MYQIEMVPQNSINMYWHHIAPYLPKACARTGDHLSPRGIWQDCATGNKFLLLFIEDNEVKFTVVFGGETWGEKEVAVITCACGGEIDKWKEALPSLKGYLKTFGFNTIAIGGPENVYGRVFKEAKKAYTVYKMEIE